MQEILEQSDGIALLKQLVVVPQKAYAKILEENDNKFVMMVPLISIRLCMFCCFLLFCKCPECGNNCKGTNLCPNTQSECHCRSA